STVVYQPKPGVRSSAPIHQPKPIRRHAATPAHGSHAETGRARPASHIARPMARGGRMAPSGSFASAANPKTARPAAQSPRRPSRHANRPGAAPAAGAAEDERPGAPGAAGGKEPGAGGGPPPRHKSRADAEQARPEPRGGADRGERRGGGHRARGGLARSRD